MMSFRAVFGFQNVKQTLSFVLTEQDVGVNDDSPVCLCE